MNIDKLITVNYPFAKARDLAEFIGIDEQKVRNIARVMGVKHASTTTMNIGGILCKRCPKCGVTKELERFYIDNNRQDGISCWCSKCKYALIKKGRTKKTRAGG